MSLFLFRHACQICNVIRIPCRTMPMWRSLSASRITLNQPKSKAVAPSTEQDGGQLQTSFAKKTKEGVKTASYATVIIIGVGVTCVVLYVIFKELFSSDSANNIFQSASEKCINHPKVQDILGEPIKAFGEETSRRRRRHVAQLHYQDEQGHKGLRIQFHLQGLRKRALVEVDAREDEQGRMKTRYIMVVTEDMYRNTVVVEDNR